MRCFGSPVLLLLFVVGLLGCASGPSSSGPSSEATSPAPECSPEPSPEPSATPPVVTAPGCAGEFMDISGSYLVDVSITDLDKNELIGNQPRIIWVIQVACAMDYYGLVALVGETQAVSSYTMTRALNPEATSLMVLSMDGLIEADGSGVVHAQRTVIRKGEVASDTNLLWELKNPQLIEVPVDEAAPSLVDLMLEFDGVFR